MGLWPESSRPAGAMHLATRRARIYERNQLTILDSIMHIRHIAASLLAVLVVLGMTAPAEAQFENKWLAGGSLHHWYSAAGSEPESLGPVGNSQDGMRFPGLYVETDMQVWQGLWIGAQDVTGADGTNYPVRVVHAGPRVSGANEMFPTRFDLVSRFPLPTVTVDGQQSFPAANMVVDEVDPDIPASQMIVNNVNTLLGVTMERRVMQFSQSYHDNYHLVEYTFTNTGNTDLDEEIELPSQTIQDMVVFLQWRWAPAREARYVIGNATGWGRNTMVDIWGDGVDENFPGSGDPLRAVYAWHGYFPEFTLYDNIGAPILPSALPATNISPADTSGRLAAYQFVGTATLHADAGANDDTDAAAQPFTKTWIHSDDLYQSGNSAFDVDQMMEEYDVMTAGEKTPSHAYQIEPTGLSGWMSPSTDPDMGTTGGFSAGTGYGPYTLAPGESVSFVVAEAAAGISREVARETGSQYKRGDISDLQKNEVVFQGRDSLYQTFQRAIANYNSGYAIPKAPPPPSSFTVESGGDRISLSWDYTGDTPLSGFEIYRARGAFDSTYTLIHEAGAGETTFDDTTPIRGVNYFYYIVAVGQLNNDDTGMTPTGVRLRSNRTYTQTYTPARLKRPMGEAFSELRIVPNPVYLGSSETLRFSEGEMVDRLAFFNVPGQCRIDIYTELGEHVRTITHTDGSGDEFWDLETEAGQIVASGLYIAVVTVTSDIEDIWQEGQRAYRKFVVIR